MVYATKDRSENHEQPPLHPGKLMKDLLLPQRSMTPELVSQRSGLSLDWLKDFMNEKVSMEQKMRKPLKRVFGVAAETLYRMQISYDHYQTHGRRPGPNANLSV